MTAIALACLVTVQLANREPREGNLRVSEGLWLGVLIGIAFYLAEALTAQAIKIWLINALHVSPDTLEPKREYKWSDGRLVRMGWDGFTRNATPITLIMWPAMMAALGAIAPPWNRWVAALLLTLAAAAVVASPHESSKLALAAGFCGFAIAWLSSALARRAIAAIWVAACLAIVPAALLMHRLELHHAEWLQHSARHRIVIWNTTAEQVLKAPLFGVGAHTTYVKGQELVPETPIAPNEEFAPTLSRHAHNVFLQTWLELGAIGALLLAVAGWQVVERIGQARRAVQPFAYASLCSAAALMATSYGMWQGWYMALFGLAPILFAIGARSLDTSKALDHDRARSHQSDTRPMV
jgi:hypothetical protein